MKYLILIQCFIIIMFTQCSSKNKEKVVNNSREIIKVSINNLSKFGFNYLSNETEVFEIDLPTKNKNIINGIAVSILPITSGNKLVDLKVILNNSLKCKLSSSHHSFFNETEKDQWNEIPITTTGLGWLIPANTISNNHYFFPEEYAQVPGKYKIKLEFYDYDNRNHEYHVNCYFEITKCEIPESSCSSK